MQCGVRDASLRREPERRRPPFLSQRWPLLLIPTAPLLVPSRRAERRTGVESEWSVPSRACAPSQVRYQAVPRSRQARGLAADRRARRAECLGSRQKALSFCSGGRVRVGLCRCRRHGAAARAFFLPAGRPGQLARVRSAGFWIFMRLLAGRQRCHFSQRAACGDAGPRPVLVWTVVLHDTS